MGIYSSQFDVAYNSIILLLLGKKGTVFSGDGILLIIIIDTANVRVLEVKVNSTGGWSNLSVFSFLILVSKF